MKYVTTLDNNYRNSYDELEEVAQVILDEFPDNIFDYYLNKQYGDVSICDFIYSASEALKEIDLDAYSEEKYKYKNSKANCIFDILQKMQKGDSKDIFGVLVEVME